jgi:hypothetical protein
VQSNSIETNSSTTPAVRLEAMFDAMNADQIKLVSSRYNAPAKASRVYEAENAIKSALKSEKLLLSMLEKLSDLERAALDFVAVHGNPIHGWALIGHVACLGFGQPRLSASPHFYRRHLSEELGVRLIGTLLRDGLLIPLSPTTSCFAGRSYYSGSSGSANSDLLCVDERVLAALKKMPVVTSGVVPRLELESVAASLVSVHPAKLLLEVAEVMNLVLEDGSVSITRDGRIAKAVFSKFAKRRPWLATRIETHLISLLVLGLLVEGSDALKPDLQAWHDFESLSLEMRYRRILGTYQTVTIQADIDGSGHPVGIKNARLARQGLIVGIGLLPDYPVLLEPALKAMYERVLRYFTGEENTYSYSLREKVPTVAVPAFFRTELTSTMHQLGLVALEESKNKLQTVIGIGVGTKWLMPSDLARDQAVLVTPCLLIQANFDVLVYLEQLSPEALKALRCADCQRIDAQTAMFSLSRASVYRALETGMDNQTILQLLQTYSVSPIPSNVRSSIQEWSGRRDRLSLTEKITLLEFHNAIERNSSLAQIPNSQAIGERFLLVERMPKNATLHWYSSSPNRTLVFRDDGSFQMQGGSDLAARAVIATVAIPQKKGGFVFNQTAVRQGLLNASSREIISARVKGNFPPSLEALLSIWDGRFAAPSLVATTVFQHELALALSTHAALEPFFAATLNETTLLVKAGAEKSLEIALKSLGIAAQMGLQANLEASQIKAISELQSGLNTRKMREMIEAAIENNRDLDVEYDEENVYQARYGYPEKYRGSKVREKLSPTDVSYSASTPYFSGVTLEGKKTRLIRIGYIHGIAVL